MRKFIIAALASGAVSCASLGPRYYLTETPRTVLTPKADAVLVHIDEKLSLQLSTLLVLGRKEQLEQAACLRVDPSRPNTSHELWVDSLLTAAIVSDRTTIVQVVYSCDHDAVPWHAHVVYARDGYDQCAPSPIDMSSGWAKYPAELLSCGIGVDSIVAWKARR